MRGHVPTSEKPRSQEGPRASYPLSSVAASTAIHLVFLLLVTIWSGSIPEAPKASPPAVTTVALYWVEPKPAGGGGGGGEASSEPPSVLDPSGEALLEVTTPNVETLVFEEEPVEPPTETQSIEAPIADRGREQVAQEGVLDGPERLVESLGEGEGGGAGGGVGTGLGPGEGPGLGEGAGGGTGGGPYRLGGGVEPPVPIRNVRPDYTREALLRQLEGEVVLEVVVRRDGSVDQIRVRRSLDPGLDGKAMEAARQWRFIPGKLKGQPVDVVVDIVVAFKLY